MKWVPGTFPTLFPVVKHLVFVSWFPQILGCPGGSCLELAGCGAGSAPQAPGHPQARSPPRAGRSHHPGGAQHTNATLTEKRPDPAKCTPGAVPVLSSQLDLAGRTKETWPQAKVGRTGQSGGAREMVGGVLSDGRPRMDRCLLPVPGVLAMFSSSPLAHSVGGGGLGPAQGFLVPPAGCLLAPLLSHPLDHSSPRAPQGVWPVQPLASEPVSAAFASTSPSAGAPLSCRAQSGSRTPFLGPSPKILLFFRPLFAM